MTSKLQIVLADEIFLQNGFTCSAVTVGDDNWSGGSEPGTPGVTHITSSSSHYAHFLIVANVSAPS